MSRDPLDQRAPYQVSPPRYSVSHQMVTTAFELPNLRVTQNLGVVRGIVVRSRNIFATIGAGLQTIVDVGAKLATACPLPICTAVRERRPIILESAAEVSEHFPEALPQHVVDAVRSVAAFPLKLDDQVTGVLLVRFDRDQAIAPADRSLMAAMSRIAAETFERVRLFDAEREARHAALVEAARRIGLSARIGVVDAIDRSQVERQRAA